ncbi:hypothetical protein [Cupriavidus pauculus]|uniref:hypothetical protein n=1 Tax=Cupriavidus pauculus TaxID=82633 RepID=UPI001EE2FA49|nr:hypothetical protein [Cupriavidus pauculus]GJG94538.1 hypothetical protein CBA19C6_08635 [Cupriavidus pauculus]
MALLIEVVGWLFVELIFYTVFYAIGWVALMAVTLGRYPGHFEVRWRSPDGLVDAELVALAGLLVTVAAVIAFVSLTK